MNKIIFVAILSQILWAGKSYSKPRTLSAEKDGIVILASADKMSDGRTLIKCEIANQSEHIFAAAFTRSWSKAFRFTLINHEGVSLQMDKDWALKHAQPNGTNDSAFDSRSLWAAYIHPEKSESFQFYLEDAYAERAKEGKELIVKWINSYSKEVGVIHVDEIRHADGTITPAYEEKNHFPGRRVFEVKLPLTNLAAASNNEQFPNLNALSKNQPDEELANKARSQARNTHDDTWQFDRRWLALLLIPIAFLFRRIVCTKKQ